MSPGSDATHSVGPLGRSLAESWRQIREAAQGRLGSSPYAPLRGVTCDFREGVLTLRGRVSSFYLKQLAQTLVAKVPGVEMVVNNVEVSGPGR